MQKGTPTEKLIDPTTTIEHQTIDGLLSIMKGDEEMYAYQTRALRLLSYTMVEADEPYSALDYHRHIENPQLLREYRDELHDTELKPALDQLAEIIEEQEIDTARQRLRTHLLTTHQPNKHPLKQLAEHITSYIQH